MLKDIFLLRSATHPINDTLAHFGVLMTVPRICHLCAVHCAYVIVYIVIHEYHWNSTAYPNKSAMINYEIQQIQQKVLHQVVMEMILLC